MSEQDKHTPLYSSSDIEKYLNGELSAPEMHALERAALDDPFLADALDGMEIHRHFPEQPSFSQDVAGLQQRLRDRVAEKGKAPVRRIPRLMRYAAAVILLAGLGLTAYYTFLTGKSRPEFAVQKTQEHPAATVPPPATVPPAATAPPPTAVPPPAAENASVPQNTPVSRSVASTRRTPALSTPGRNSPSTPGRKKDEDAVLSLTDNSQADAVASRKAVLDTLRPRFDTAALLAGGRTHYLTQPPPSNNIASQLSQKERAVERAYDYKRRIADKLVFSGKVTDLHNNPIPGASVVLKNDQTINAMTDKYGYFNLQVNANQKQKWDNRQDSSYSAVVNHIGYEPGSIYLNTENKKSNFIQLQPQAATLNEVQIVGFGAKRKEILRQNIDARQKDLSLVAVPSVGWPAYQEYLESGKKIANLDSTLRGYETISFIVNYKGELSSFKVEQSISPAHDSATIRMVKQGPAWHLTSGKKARARVILTY